MKQVETCEQEVRGIGMIAVIFVAIVISLTTTGCMQLTGAKKITMGTWVIESNSGFEVSAGAMQYDHALDRKGMNVEQTDNKKMDRY